MLRTRDLVLFILVLFFLGLAISVTVIFDSNNSRSGSSWADITDTAPSNYEAEAPEIAVIDRQSNLERLREKLASDNSNIAPDPDTFVGSEDVTEGEAEAAAEAEAAVTSTVSKCLYPDDVVPKLASWPLTGVMVTVEGSFRVVSATEVVAIEALPIARATTTAPKTETISTTLLRLPLTPQKNATASCLPSEIIGVTTGGFVLFNNDASVWQNAGTDTLIGYARDGFPIYGLYTGTVDACGGYNHPTGYRYSLSPDRTYMIGCFSASPQSFNL